MPCVTTVSFVTACFICYSLCLHNLLQPVSFVTTYVICYSLCHLLQPVSFVTACAFWMIFGGTRIPEDALSFANASDFSMNVAGLATAGSLMFSLFRLTLVDDYDFDVSHSYTNLGVSDHFGSLFKK